MPPPLLALAFQYGTTRNVDTRRAWSCRPLAGAFTVPAVPRYDTRCCAAASPHPFSGDSHSKRLPSPSASLRPGEPAEAANRSPPIPTPLRCVVGCADQDFRRPIMLLWSEPKPHMLVQQEVNMTGIVEVVVPVEASAALTDAHKREAVGRIVSHILRPLPDHDPLLEVMDRFSADAAAKGLKPETLEAELAAHEAERTR